MEKKSISILLLFYGSLDSDNRFNTVGDVMSVYNVATWFLRQGFRVHIRWDGELFDLNESRISEDAARRQTFDAICYVCGPLRDWIAPYVKQFSSRKRFAIGVSVLSTYDPTSDYDYVGARDSRDISTFDLAFADIGYPHISADRRLAFREVGVSLVGPQREYGEDAGHSLVVEAIRSIDKEFALVPIQTLLRPDSLHVYDAELLFQTFHAVVTTRMHGALLSAFHGVPVIAIDQIRGGGKVSRIVGASGLDVVNGWALDVSALRKQLTYLLANGPAVSQSLQIVRQNIIRLSREALHTHCSRIVDAL